MVLDAPLVLDTLCLAIYSNDADTKRIIESVVDLYNEAVRKGELFNDAACKLYIDILKEISENGLDTENEAELSSLLLKFKADPVVKDDPAIMQYLKEVITNRQTVGRGRVRSLKNRVKKMVMVIKGNGNLKQLFRIGSRLMSSSDPKKQDALYLKLIDESRQLAQIYENRYAGEETSIAHIDMTCVDSVRRGLESFKAKRADRGYKLGIQQFSNMFGPAGGPIPGECIAFAACSYHYKSGAMMDFCRWIAQYNIPKKQTEKPAAILFVSLENEIHENMMMWFRSAYINTFHKSPDELSDEEVVSTIVQLFKKNGFTLHVHREDGDTFGWEEYKALYDKYAIDYEMLASFVDYWGLMRLPDDGAANDAKKLQELVGKIKNHGARNNMMTISGLQLNGLAEELAKSGKHNIVKMFGAAHLADAKAIKRELDVLIFLHIEENHLGTRYLTGWLDKHKYAKMPPENERYIAIPFTEDGLMDDIYGESSHVADIYNITTDGNTSAKENELF